GFKSTELGHPNYQHPRRAPDHFGPFLDNFSAWVIYTSLCCLSVDGTLWTNLAGGDECLLFRSSDFGDPCSSYTFSLLEKHSSDEIRRAACLLRKMCDMAPEEVPHLGASLDGPKNLAQLRTSPVLPSWASRSQGLSNRTTKTANAPANEANENEYPNFREYNEA